MAKNLPWVGTRTMSPAPAESGAFSNQTLRMTMRASLGGDTARVRISNAYGHRLLDIGTASCAVRSSSRESSSSLLSSTIRKPPDSVITTLHTR
jgi:hypothetical protein